MALSEKYVNTSNLIFLSAVFLLERPLCDKYLKSLSLKSSVPSILPKFSDQKTGSRRVVGWHKKSEKYFGFILAAKPRLRWVPEESLNFRYISSERAIK